MNKQRILTVLLHTWFHFTHSMETWVDVFWNSAIQMLVFVFIAASFIQSGGGNQAVNMILGMIFWNIIWIGQYGVTVGALWEIWSRSFSSLFITPLSFNEFLLGQMISGFIKSLAAFIMAALIGYWLFDFSVFSFGTMLPVYYLLLLIFSWGTGFLVLSLILKLGTDVQSLSWALVFLVQPFGAVFYAVSVLPSNIRWITGLFPTTYVFEAMRTQFFTGIIMWNELVLAAVINLIYLAVSYLVLARSLDTAKRSGAFARMEG